MVVGDASFCELSVDHSLPQGSVINPQLFLLLVNNLSSIDEALLYKVDTRLKMEDAKVGEIDGAALENLVAVKHCFKNNRLKLNTVRLTTWSVLFVTARQTNKTSGFCYR